MRNLLTILIAAASALLLPTICATGATYDETRPNVVLICVDDLRPQLGCYGETMMHTPRLDRLASQGRVFTRHFVTVPTCGASRYALMTSTRPSTAAERGNNAFDSMRKRSQQDTDGPESMPHLFRMNGYDTVCIGKVSHHPSGLAQRQTGPTSNNLEMPQSWDEVFTPTGQWNDAWQAFFAYADGTGRNERRHDGRPIPPTESADVDDNGYPDGLIAQAAVRKLAEMRDRQVTGEQEAPFFLAVGFFKPHLPFNAPEKYWNLYPPDAIDLSPARHPSLELVPKAARHSSGEMFQYTHPKNARTDEEHHRHLRRAYFAAVSYVDAQIGKVLDALDENGLSENTIVVVWGDHGWHLGDLDMWGKHTLYDWALRSALIIRTPSMIEPGRATDAIVSTIDLYPTLADLCELEIPNGLVEGSSFRSILDEGARLSGKKAAISFWRRGVSIRTARYRLTLFADDSHPSNADPAAIELYDLEADPLELINVAKQHPETVEALRALLESEWSADQR